MKGNSLKMIVYYCILWSPQYGYPCSVMWLWYDNRNYTLKNYESSRHDEYIVHNPLVLWIHGKDKCFVTPDQFGHMRYPHSHASHMGNIMLTNLHESPKLHLQMGGPNWVGPPPISCTFALFTPFQKDPQSVMDCRSSGKFTCCKLWLNSWPKVNERRLVGKVTCDHGSTRFGVFTILLYLSWLRVESELVKATNDFNKHVLCTAMVWSFGSKSLWLGLVLNKSVSFDRNLEGFIHFSSSGLDLQVEPWGTTSLKSNYTLKFDCAITMTRIDCCHLFEVQTSNNNFLPHVASKYMSWKDLISWSKSVFQLPNNLLITKTEL